ncbi:hypothetical protein D3C78_1062950 [compost metagenome]
MAGEVQAVIAVAQGAHGMGPARCAGGRSGAHEENPQPEKTAAELTAGGVACRCFRPRHAMCPQAPPSAAARVCRLRSAGHSFNTPRNAHARAGQ